MWGAAALLLAGLPLTYHRDRLGWDLFGSQAFVGSAM
jgi:hypothetical protein